MILEDIILFESEDDDEKVNANEKRMTIRCVWGKEREREAMFILFLFFYLFKMITMGVC
jgi:hypothetical protein